MLSLQNITYSTPYPRIKTIFKNVSLEVAKGQHSIVYADNGRGKTTLLNLLMGMLEPISGEVTGGPSEAYSVFENFSDQLVLSTVEEELVSAGKYNIQEREQVLDILELDKLTKNTVFELSYSQRARLLFALAYLSGREYIIMDSPPADVLIDKMINYILSKDLRTFLLLLYDKDTRSLDGDWTKYVIENKKILNLVSACS